MMRLLTLANVTGDAVTRTVIEFARLRQFTQWWYWFALIATCAAILTYIGWLYRKDAVSLPFGVRSGLLVLRIAVFVGLLIFFLDLEKRTERQVTRTSRVATLVDTSQSMGLTDVSGGAAKSRIQQIVDEFSQGELLNRLLDRHDVVVYRFDQKSVPEQVAFFSRTKDANTSVEINPEASQITSWHEARRLYMVAISLAISAVLLIFLNMVLGRFAKGAEGESYLLLAGTVVLIAGLVVGAVSNLRNPNIAIAEVLSSDQPSPTVAQAPTSEPTAIPPQTDTTDWKDLLVPRGLETRLGDALRFVVDRENQGTLAGVLLLTDGCHNAGVTPETVVKAASENDVPLFPIGLGSERPPRQIRLVDLEIPLRVYPGDRYTITGYVQASGLAGRTVQLQLERTTMNDQPLDPPLQMDRRITLGTDGEILPVQFEVVPDDIGRHKWSMRVSAANESDDLDPRDNQRTSTVQVVERKSKVLLVAGGPSREYRFLRNLLFRDPTVEVDVRLQSAPEDAAQEATKLLFDLPSERDELFQYDCIVAFDPAWTELTTEQLELLDEWVAEKAGGLIVVAGPVNTSNWSRGRHTSADDAKIAIVKNLYPVTFYRSGAATIQLGRAGSDQAWPLEFTEEGLRAPFLWLEDSPTGSENTWNDFPGVYGYQALRRVKPGAQIYARFSDPSAATSDEKPVYMAGQFYGAGRVFYLGSGEMWRLNALDIRYFETFYTKLIRHVSQGRLLRDSTRGVLLVDKEKCSLGDTVTARAVLSDSQYQPLSLDTVEAVLVHEGGTREVLKFRRLPNAEREGMYSGQFTTARQGDYRIDLPIPDSNDELLTRSVKVRLPAREIEQPQRNDALLSALASQTDGQYYVGIASALGQRQTAALHAQIRSKDQVTYLPGTPDNRFDSQLMGWLLTLVCGCLSLEWLIRRIYKLA